MTCPRCSSTRLFKFEADKNLPAPIASLPVACRDCGLVTIDGRPVAFPAELEAQIRTLTEASAATGAQAAVDLAADPNQPIAAYFTRVYRNGYLAGFWRAFLFLRHNNREGRIKRIRELWKRLPVQHHFEATAEERKVYAEIGQLLSLGDNDATGSAYEDPSKPERSA